MEPVGFAIGVAGLAGVFNSCVDVVEKIDAYRDFGIDSLSLGVQFEADKLRFKNWVQAVGFQHERLLDGHHKAFDDPLISSVVENLLSCIQEICRTSNKVTPQSLGGSDMVLFQNGGQLHLHPSSGSKMSRIGWVLKDKTKYTARVQRFGELVQCLYNLVPPDSEKLGNTRISPLIIVATLV
jgi:Prion-inhibition and propagation